MNLIRKYKCYKSFNIVDEKTKEIFDFVDENILNLEKFEWEDAKWKNLIFYMNSNGKCILEFYLKHGWLYVSFPDFWHVLEYKYKLNYSEINEYIKYQITKLYKIKVKESYKGLTSMIFQVENAYKLKIKL